MDLKFSDEEVKDPRWVREKSGLLVKRFPKKIGWFMEHGYQPHFYQLWFHCSTDENDRLTRWRSLVAGRRGGKTLSAAWETAYYLIHPDQWWLDAHGRENNEDAWWWFLAADHKVGLAGHITFRQVLRSAGLLANKDYKENRQEKFFEFERGRIDFRSADNPSSLVGAGLNGLWIDESAKIPNEEAWTIVRPCLSDKMGCGLFTTTPEGKNWFYDEFHGDDKRLRPDISRVEYRSLDNTYFRKEEWDTLLETYHPLAFKREYMASFDAFAGRDLPGDWLHYYTWDDLPRVEGRPHLYDLDYYVGVDPAISMADNADFFALSVIGVPKGSATHAFLIESVNLHIPFAEQLDIIKDYQVKYNPVYIGIEQTAYQRALVQQATRLDNSPNVIGVDAKGTKAERIISMSPAFRLAKVTIQQTNKRFIDEWLDYDTTNKNAQDDVLDSVEIALRIAGVISEDPVELAGGMKATVEHPDKWIHAQQPKEIEPEEYDDYEDGLYSSIMAREDDAWYYD
jgi:phage terminase large subunit-like protein